MVSTSTFMVILLLLGAVSKTFELKEGDLAGTPFPKFKSLKWADVSEAMCRPSNVAYSNVDGFRLSSL